MSAEGRFGMRQSGHGTRIAGGCLLADDLKLEKSRFSQTANSKAFPSRDSLGVRHVISRLLGQFETFRAELGKGESRDCGRHDLRQIA
jgi:hypothetical protein